MKRLFHSLPLTLLLIGCGAPNQDVTATSATTDNKTASSDTTTTADTNSVAASNAEQVASTDNANTTQGSYKVVDEAPPRSPAGTCGRFK